MGVTGKYFQTIFVIRITFTLKEGKSMGALSDNTDIFYSVYHTN